MANGAVSATQSSLLSRLCKDPQDASAWDEFVDCYGPRIEAWAGRREDRRVSSRLAACGSPCSRAFNNWVTSDINRTG
jgi:hypothetical protein